MGLLQTFALRRATATMVAGGALASLIVPATASAQSAPPDSAVARDQAAAQVRDDAEAERASRKWYGGYVLAVDIPSILVLDVGTALGMGDGGSVSGGGAAALAVGGVGYAFGAPIVHWIEGDVGAGWGSFGLHMGGFLAGIGFQGSVSTTHGTALAVTPITGLIYAVPTVLDVLLLSRSRQRHDWSGSAPNAAWAPTLQVRQGGAVLGLGATF
jgi:hypothetical protein